MSEPKFSERIRKRGVQAEREPGSSKIIAGVLRRWADEIEALEAELEAWTEKGALFVEQGDRLSKMEEAARPFVVMRFDDDGIAGHDATGHPLSHEGMARKRLREALAGESEET